MNYDNHNRFLDMARCYHLMAPYTVPQYSWMQDKAVSLLSRSDFDPSGLVVDLGGGSGRLARRVLEAFPQARVSIVDSSSTFLDLAREYLTDFKDRCSFIEKQLEDDWESALPEAPSAILSMSCIHHLLPEEKDQLYHRAVDCLKPRGWLINVDEMIGHSDDAYRRHMEDWWQWGLETEAKVPTELQPAYCQFMEHFRNWKVRNIDHGDQAKQKGDDLHQPINVQLESFKNAGLVEVDAYFSYLLWHAAAGRKPAS